MAAGKKNTATPRRSQTAASATKSTPIRIWNPDIHDTPIISAEQLRHLINDQYPGLTRNPQFPQLLTDAEKHLTLITLLHNEHNLRRGDFTRLAREVGASRQLVSAYVQAARKPRLYYLIEHSLAKTDAHTKLTKIHRDNHGTSSTDDVKRRLATYYLTPFHEKSFQYQRRLAQCDAYFRALKMLKDGGCLIDAARALGVHHTQVSRWFSGHRPDLVDLARRIPDQLPPPDGKWLPLGMNQAFHPTGSIQVPNRIASHIQIKGVLSQLSSLDNASMKQWEERFGPVNREDAFYYLLGLIVSDFAKKRPRTSSTELVLNLSKTYLWAPQLGEAACYYLGILGIHAGKAEDTASSRGPQTCYSWRSQKSPFVTWMTCTCLGLREDERTTFDSIKADWLLEAPVDARIAFLQGLNDGDGWASIKTQCVGNACAPNIPFVKALLSTFGINATDDRRRVRIQSRDGIIRASELPFFRHATGRQENATKLAQMMRIRQRQCPGITSHKMAETIERLRSQGLSYGEIATHIFDRFGVSLDHGAVMRRIRKERMEKP